MKNSTLVVVPAYNEEKNILKVIEDLNQFRQDYDYVVINDGSSDETSALCRENDIPVIDLPVNLGLTGAFLTGMKYAKEEGYKSLIQFDADGQHHAEYIADLKAALKENNIVIGSRFVKEKKPFSPRMLGSNIISFAIKITTRVKLTDPTSGFRIFDSSVIDKFVTRNNMSPEPDTLSCLIKEGCQVSEVQVAMSERISGESYLNFTRSISYMLRMTVSILLIQIFNRNK